MNKLHTLSILTFLLTSCTNSNPTERAKFLTSKDIEQSKIFDAPNKSEYTRIILHYGNNTNYSYIEDSMVCLPNHRIKELPSNKEALEALEGLNGDIAITTTLKDSTGELEEKTVDGITNTKYVYQEGTTCKVASFFRKK